jgi:Ni,Fe-hydrogenase III large subunit
MSRSFPLGRWSVAEVEALPGAAWAERVGALLDGGARVVTAFGRRDGPDVLASAVVQSAAGELELVRGRLDRELGYHALTPTHPVMHCFERELHEQTGVRIAGHPWLKPVRYEGAAPGAMAAHPFYRVQGKEVHEVQVGPIHAGVIEPGAFRFMCLGEKVQHLEIQLGYQHRGVEALLLRGDPRAHAQLVETIAGDTSVAHAWAYCAAIEALTGRDADAWVERGRGIGLELERIAMHLAGLGGLAGDIGFLQGATTYGRLRTTAINTSMRLCGSRFGRGWLRPGASRAAADAALVGVVRANLALLVRDLAVINDRFVSSATVKHRFQGAGALTAEQARDLGLVGPPARACGVELDQRAFGLGQYGESPVEVSTESAGDCWARALVRIEEIDRSLAWLTRRFEGMTALAPAQHPVGAVAPGQFVVSLCEGWRGEVVHGLETDTEGRLVHYKVQDPSLRNWFGLALALRENEISDFPICNKSFDLSYCGHDL